MGLNRFALASTTDGTSSALVVVHDGRVADLTQLAAAPPRSLAERTMFADLRRWTEMPRGGHFAALEQPDLLAEDVRAFAASLPR